MDCVISILFITGAGYSLGDFESCAGLFCDRTSFNPSIPNPVSKELNNKYFKDLLENKFEEISVTGGNKMYKVIKHLLQGY